MAGVTLPGSILRQVPPTFSSARVTMRLCKVPGTRHKFSKSNLFFLIGDMSCDPGKLDLMFAFKELWGSPVESVQEVLPTEESPGCCASTEKWHLIKSRRKERGSVGKCHRDSETPVLQ